LVAALVATADVFVNPDVQPQWAAALCGYAAAAMLLFRRAAPLVTMTVVGAAVGFETSLGVPPNAPLLPVLALVVAAYAVGVRLELGRALAGMLLALPGLAVSTLHLAGDAQVKLGNFAFAAVITGGAWVAGRVVHAQTGRAVAAAVRAEQLEAEQVRIVAAERARIARELHDVIGHSISVMVVQAGAAEAVLPGGAEVVRGPLQAIQDTGRQAVTEMSRLIGLLRDDHAELGLEPQPGLARLTDILQAARQAGVEVEVRVEGHEMELSAGLDLSAYRIVQEALTNVIKHAPGARSQVSLCYLPDCLRIEVSNTGGIRPHDSEPRPSGGHGLLGMRERVHLLGGAFEAGRAQEGGYVVRATLPFSPATA
jgi:signal transduction histidine kinase